MKEAGVTPALQNTGPQEALLLMTIRPSRVLSFAYTRVPTCLPNRWRDNVFRPANDASTVVVAARTLMFGAAVQDWTLASRRRAPVGGNRILTAAILVCRVTSRSRSSARYAPSMRMTGLPGMKNRHIELRCLVVRSDRI